MNTKKLLALLMAVLFVATAMVGCNQTPEDVDTNDTTTTVSTTTGTTAGTSEGDGDMTTTASTTAASDKDDAQTTTKAPSSSAPKKTTAATKPKTTTSTTKKVDGFSSGGNTGDKVTLGFKEIKNLPKLSSKVKDKNVTFLTHAYPDSKNHNALTVQVPQYDLTLHYVVVPYANKLTRLIQMNAAGDTPDLIGMDETYLTLLANNLTQSAEPYIDFSDKVWDDVRSKHNARKWKGQIHEVIQHATPSRYFFFNAKMFKAQGLKTPVEYYKKGDWTWSRFLDLAKKLTLDLNNDGITDQWGFGGESLQFLTMGAVNESFIKMDKNGKILNNMKSAGLAKAMNMLGDLQTKQKSFNASASFNSLLNNQIAMGYFGMWNISTVSGAEERVINGTLGVVPAPRAEGMKKHYNFPLYESQFILKGAKNPYAAGAYLTYMHYAEDLTNEKKYPKEWYEMVEASQTNLMTATSNRDVSAAASMEWSICGDLQNGKSWSSLVAQWSPKLDASLAQLPNNK